MIMTVLLVEAVRSESYLYQGTFLVRIANNSQDKWTVWWTAYIPQLGRQLCRRKDFALVGKPGVEQLNIQTMSEAVVKKQVL